MIRPRPVTRRSFLRSVIGGGAVGGSMALVGCGPLMRAATNEQVCVDGDTGANADPIDGGRGCAGRQRTNITDNDTGQGSDPVDYGRGGGPRRPAGSGAPQNGSGVGGSRQRESGLTDSDVGASADPAGNGRTGR